MLLIKTTLDVSRIHGIGLFADQFIPDGTVVWRFSPIIDIRFPESLFESLSEDARKQIKKYSYRERSSGLYVLCGDDARFFNHSDEPNCLDLYSEHEGDITVARQDISRGQELTCDYSLFDLDLIEGRYQLPTSSAISEPRSSPDRRPTL
jgi:SET domain-containing protein